MEKQLENEATTQTASETREIDTVIQADIQSKQDCRLRYSYLSVLAGF